MMKIMKAYRAEILTVTGWLVAMALLSSILSGCVPQERPSTLEGLLQTESVITAGTETFLQAVELGSVDVSSREYMAAYKGLERAGLIMDSAWVAYRSGNIGQAETSRIIAMDAYTEIRPLLLQLTGN